MNTKASEISNLLEDVSYEDIVYHLSARVKDIIAKAKDHGCIIAYGVSDDILSITGYIDDEVDAYDGGVAFVYNGAMLARLGDICDECPYHEEVRNKSVRITATWGEREEGARASTWELEANVPHWSFNVKRDDNPMFCKGIVIDLNVARDYMETEELLSKHEEE